MAERKEGQSLGAVVGVEIGHHTTSLGLCLTVGIECFHDILHFTTADERRFSTEKVLKGAAGILDSDTDHVLSLEAPQDLAAHFTAEHDVVIERLYDLNRCKPKYLWHLLLLSGIRTATLMRV
jgi:hypothetical protein